MSTCLHVKRFRLIHLPSTLFLIAFHSYLEFELPGQPAARDSWSQSVMPIICPQSPRQQTFPPFFGKHRQEVYSCHFF